MMIRISKSFCQLDYYILFTIPYKVVFKDLAYFLGTATLGNNSLRVRTISIAYTIPCQILFVPTLTFIGVVLGRSVKLAS